MYTIKKCDSNVCQYRFTIKNFQIFYFKQLSLVRLDFEDVMLSQPMMGDCTNDTLMVSQVDGVSTAVVPMTLCGTLTGQHSTLHLTLLT